MDDDGWRILNYLEARASNENDTLLFVGYQAEGTRGRKLLEGEKGKLNLWQNYTLPDAIKKIEGLSAHGDQKICSNGCPI